MNEGSLLLQSDFFDLERLRETCASIRQEDWRPVHKKGDYADDRWVSLYVMDNGQKTEHYERFPAVDEVAKRFKCQINRMMFYALLPGGVLHPHRDMTGAVGLNGLRFHIPIITNERVTFQIEGQPVVMRANELWALDTSFLHAVRNDGDEPRIHLILEVQVNDWVLSLLPRRDPRYYRHQLQLLGLGAQKFASALRDPRKLRARIPVVLQVYERIKHRLTGLPIRIHTNDDGEPLS
jgi:hypothetical protein